MNSPLFPFPVMLPTTMQITQVSCGGFHTAAVCKDGFIYTWGCNTSGQLGLGEKDVRTLSSPKMVSALKSMRVRKISCGFSHTAAIVDDMTEDSTIARNSTLGKGLGRVYTWGSNEFGALGITPAPVSPIPFLNTKKTSSSAHIPISAHSSFNYSSGTNFYSPMLVESLCDTIMTQIDCGHDRTAGADCKYSLLSTSTFRYLHSLF
jgi:alpha-tubulin suppressor-like RCC1 family protein